MPKIFISYRRSGAAGYAGRIHERLASVFGPSSVFMDVDDLKPGSEFPLAIDDAVASSDVLLVLIDNEWLDLKDKEGRRRLDDPADFVHREVTAALKRNLRVIPVLLNAARLPAQRDLPQSLRRLADYQALELSEERWDYDIERLISALGGNRNRRLKRAAAVAIAAAAVVVVLAFYATQPRIDLNGTWIATVPYEFSSPQKETFVFEHHGATLRGAASFLGAERLIVDGKADGDQISFLLKTSEQAGDEKLEAVHYYRGTVAGDEIAFVMQTEGGFSVHPPIRFNARRR